MISQLPPNLAEFLSEQIMVRMEGKNIGHCLRIDHVGLADAHQIAQLIIARNAAFETWILRADQQDLIEYEIHTQKAIEKRNLKISSLVLMIPPGQEVPGSLDNSFEKLSLTNLFEAAKSQFRDQLNMHEIGNVIQQILRVRSKRVRLDQMVIFMALVLDSPTLETIGRELWRVGLIPDHDIEHLVGHIGSNQIAADALAYPSRPVAGVLDRLTNAGLRDGLVKTQLQFYFEETSTPLSDVNTWCNDLGANHSGVLTFDQWPLADQVESDIRTLVATPFRKPNGKVEPACRLEQDSDGNLSCKVSETSPARVGIGWVTLPAKIHAVANWRLDLVPPSDLRDSSTEPIITTKVKGDKRRATLAIDLNEDDLAGGNRFVVRITALDENGDIISLLSGLPAEVDSDEFDVLWEDQPVGKSQRKGTARSVADAVLQASLAGQDHPSEEITLEIDDGFVGLKLADRRKYRIPISPLIVDLQLHQLQNADTTATFSATLKSNRALEFADISRREIHLPTGFAEKRTAVLKLLSGRFPRHLVESAYFDEELRNAVKSYASSYRRSLENASDEQLADLLSLDRLLVSADTAGGPVEGAIILPTHPIRLLWISEHDSLLRTWASELVDSDSVSERLSRLDMNSVRRISPANIPFMISDVIGNLGIYAEETTYGCGLYIFDTGVEFEVVAELMSTALGLSRQSSEHVSNARQISDRLRLYRDGHSHTETMRILNLNPGEGRLLSDSLKGLFGDDSQSVNDDLPAEDLGLDIVTYARSPLFSGPVRHLAELQHRRSLISNMSANHLRPPMRLTIRQSNFSGLDSSGANIALTQDITHTEPVIIGDVSLRSPSMGGLLVSTRTEPIQRDGELLWHTYPSLKGGHDLTVLHKSFLAAISKRVSDVPGIPCVATTLSSDAVAQLRAIHARSDWVITADRYLGLDIYENSESSGLGRSFTLDYTPDFIEGFGNRLMVTTVHRPELMNVLAVAMDELGLSALGSQSLALDMLNLVSGRLALRLLSNSTRAREAVSLAALMSHLKLRGKLDGQIVIPVDSHPEIFGQTLRGIDDGARRCDLLLIRVTSKSFRIECIEVKSRQFAALPNVLADRIVEQLQDTEDLIRSRFYSVDPQRVDEQLQRATFCSLLHYYADRSSQNGMIDPEDLPQLHKNIERLEETGNSPEIVLSGYVIAIQDEGGFPEKHKGVPIQVLTAVDIGAAGFTTKLDAVSRTIAPVISHGGESDGVSDNNKHNNGFSLPTKLNSDLPRTDFPIGADDRARSTNSPKHHSSVADEETLQPAAGNKPESEKPRHQNSEPSMSGVDKLPTSITVTLGHDLSNRPVDWTVSTKGSPHAFVIGIPGQGKSVTTRHIIRTFAQGNLPAIVFDFHGDMAANPPAGSLVYDVRNGLPFSPFELRGHTQAEVNATSLEIAEIVGYVCGMGEIQQMTAYKALVRAYELSGWVNGNKGSRLPTIEEFADAVESVESGAKGKNARDRIRPLTDFGLFSDDANSLFDPRGNGQGIVIDVSQLGIESVQIAASAFILRKIFKDMFMWEQSSELRLAIVLDEAHRLAKDRTLPRLMKEGRKYGVAVVVASQGVDDFHRDVLGNAGVKIVFRTNFPSSKTVAGYLRGRAGQDLSKQIEQLEVGQAYVSTPEAAQAQRINMINSD
jgi:DNA phosphorothioation-dependent restriction protein DptH